MKFDVVEQFRAASAAFGPSGRESGVIGCLDDMIAQFVPDASQWERTVDRMNNLCYRRQGRGKRILLDAHMDSVGIVVTHIDDKGFARFACVGGLMVEDLLNRAVRFANGTRGVISFEEKTPAKDRGMEQLFVDIGASSREEAAQYIAVGDFAVYCGEIFSQGNIIGGPYLDNRIGCLTLIAAMSQMERTSCDVTVAFTAQEEVGLRGAQTAAFAVQPDIAIVVDVTDTGDLPECKHPMAVKLGAGPAVKVMDRSVICDNMVRDALYRTAKRLDIAVQHEIMEFGGTDTGVIQRSREGVRVGAVSIPCRYVHSAQEMAAISDIEQAAQLIAAVVSEELDKI